MYTKMQIQLEQFCFTAPCDPVLSKNFIWGMVKLFWCCVFIELIFYLWFCKLIKQVLNGNLKAHRHFMHDQSPTANKIRQNLVITLLLPSLWNAILYEILSYMYLFILHHFENFSELGFLPGSRDDALPPSTPDRGSHEGHTVSVHEVYCLHSRRVFVHRKYLSRKAWFIYC